MRVLAASGLSGDAALRDTLIERLDITTLTSKQVEDFVRLTGAQAPPDDWAVGRQVIDLIETAPGKLSAEQLTTLLRPLPPRYYSIASSRARRGRGSASAGGRAALCVAWAGTCRGCFGGHYGTASRWR